MDREQYIQGWYCLECGAEGSIPYDDDDGALTVVNRIKKDHEEKSPHCPWDVSNIMLSFLENYFDK